MPPSPPTTPGQARYYLRRRGAAPSGPHEGAAIAALRDAGKLDGTEEISSDGRTWNPVATLFGAPGRRGGPAGAREATDAGPGSLDLDDPDSISLPPLELGFGAGTEDSGTPITAPSRGQEPEATHGTVDLGGDDAVDLGAPLELVTRTPPGKVPAAAPSAPAAGASVAAQAPRPGGAARLAKLTPLGSPAQMAAVGTPPRDPQDGTRAGDQAPAVVNSTVGSEASAAVASLLEGEAEQMADATRPVRLDEPASPPDVRVRRRTMTAARGGGKPAQTPGSRPRRRLTRRTLLIGGGAVVLAGATAAALLTDLPDRLRGEPASAKVLGAVAGDLEQDRFPAFSEAARLLEESVASRKRAPANRAEAATLLAASVVLHGGERGRIARAEALLDMDPDTAAAGPVRGRARAWVALAKGRWKDVERLVTEAALPPADRDLLLGWAALGRDEVARAASLFSSAAGAQPPPAPSRTGARVALARAREAELSPDVEGAFRAVLAGAPAHVGAALGLARASRLSAAARITLLEAIIARQARDASRAELAEAHVLIARAARETGAIDRADTAMKRAREADPAGVAAAVAAGDAALAEGRTDDAVTAYKAALAPPLSAARTPALRFARIAALLEAAKVAEAAAALTDLERKLPGDPRVGFWRARAAERARPPNFAEAERAYGEALARDPRFLPASLQLARLLLDQRRGADALAVLRRAEGQGAGAGALRVALGQALLASGNPQEAARTFRQALGADPKNPTARLGLAGALEATGDLEGARSELTALSASARGTTPGLGTRVAAVLAKLGRKQEALSAYQAEIAAGGAAPATKVAAARLALELGRKDEARKLGESAVADDPRTPGALLLLAELRRLDGDLPHALLELRRALSVDGSAEVNLEYGRALGALGRNDEALAALSQARELPEASVERGRVLLRRGDVDGAARELATATVSLPGNADAQLLLGIAEERLGHAPRAEAAFKAAVRLAPASAEARYRLGKATYDRGQAAVALPQLRAAAEHVPAVPDPTATWRAELYFTLGFAEARAGSRERAAAAFRKYLDLAPPDAPARSEAAKQLKLLD